MAVTNRVHESLPLQPLKSTRLSDGAVALERRGGRAAARAMLTHVRHGKEWLLRVREDTGDP